MMHVDIFEPCNVDGIEIRQFNAVARPVGQVQRRRIPPDELLCVAHERQIANVVGIQGGQAAIGEELNADT